MDTIVSERDMHILDDFEQLEMYREYFFIMLTKGMGWSIDRAHDWSIWKTKNNFVTLTESPGFWLSHQLICGLNERYAPTEFWELHLKIADILDLGLETGGSEWKPCDAAIGVKMAAVEALVDQYRSIGK